MINNILNSTVKVSVVEAGLKEKGNTVGTYTFQLYPMFFAIDEFDPEKTCTFQKIYAKINTTKTEPPVPEDIVEFDLVLKLSRPLFDMPELTLGRILTISYCSVSAVPFDLFKVGDEEKLDKNDKNAVKKEVTYRMNIWFQSQKPLYVLTGATIKPNSLPNEMNNPNADEKMPFTGVYRQFVPRETVQLIVDTIKNKRMNITAGVFRDENEEKLLLIRLNADSFVQTGETIKSHEKMQFISAPAKDFTRVSSSFDSDVHKTDTQAILDIEIHVDKPFLAKKKLEVLPLESLSYVPRSAEVARIMVEANTKSSERQLKNTMRDTIKAIASEIIASKSNFKGKTPEAIAEALLASQSLHLYKKEMSKAVGQYAQSFKSVQTPFYNLSPEEEFIDHLQKTVIHKAHLEVEQVFGLCPMPENEDFEFDMLLKVADEYEEEHVFSEADIAHAKRKEARPDSFFSWLEHGLYLVRRKRYDEAQESLMRAHALNQSSGECLVALAILKVESRQVEDAFTFICKAIGILPENHFLTGIKAVIHDIYEEAPEAAVVWSQYFARCKVNEPETLLEFSTYLIKQGGYYCAQAYLAKLLLRYPKTIISCLGVIRLSIVVEEYNMAREYLARAKAKDAHDLRLEKIQGDISYLTKDLDKAKRYYESVILLDKNASAVIYRRLGKILSRAQDENDIKQARTYLLKSLQKERSFSAFVDLGYVSIKLNLLADAEHALTEANLIKPADGNVWLYLAIASVLTGRPIEANQATKKAMELKATDTESMTELAKIFNDNHHERAAENVRKWTAEVRNHNYRPQTV